MKSEMALNMQRGRRAASSRFWLAAALGAAWLALMPGVQAEPAQAPLTIAVGHQPDPLLPGARPRTAPGIELVLAQNLARQQARPLELKTLSSAQLAGQGWQNSTELAFVRVPRGNAAPAGVQWHSLDYVTHPMAIMRTDTDIRGWRDLADRTVCLIRGTQYVGKISQQYGAIEQIYSTPTEALIGVRIGSCDALVHDDRFLDALLEYPEWQKFSAQLRSGEATELVLASATADRQGTEQAAAAVRAWHKQKHINTLLKSRAQEIAFEVYLEQDVPDCH